MNKKTKKRIVRYLVIPLCTLLVLLLTGIAIVLNVVFTPEKLTPLAMRLLNENLDAKVRFEKIELTFFSSFPHFELHIKNGSLIQKKDSIVGNDTLVSFASCDAAVNVRKLLFKETLDIKTVTLSQPVVHVYIDKEGRSNFDITKEDTSTTASASDGGMKLKKILVRHLAIKNAIIDFKDESTGFSSSAKNLTLSLKAADTPAKMKLKLETATEKLNFTYKNMQYVRDLKSALQADIQLDKKTRILAFRNSALRLNEVDFVLDGELKGNKEQKKLDVDIRAALKVPSLHSLWQILPATFTGKNEVQVDGEANMTLATKGAYGTGELPVTTIDLSIEKGAVAYQNFPGKISLLETRAKAVFDFVATQNAYIKTEHLKLEGTGLKVNGTVMVTQPLSSPLIHTGLKGEINLSKVKEVIPLPAGLTMDGTANLDITAQGEVDKLLKQDYNNLDIEGDIMLHNLMIASVKDTLHLGLREGMISSHRDGINKGTIKTKFTDAALKYKKDFAVEWQQAGLDIKRGRLTGKQIPVEAHIMLAGLQYRSAVKETFKAQQVTVTASASSVDIKTLQANGHINFRSLELASEPDSIQLNIQEGGLAFRRSVTDRMKADLQLTAITAAYKTGDQVSIKKAQVVLGKGKGVLQDARLKADAVVQGMKYNNARGNKVAAVNIQVKAMITPGKTWASPAVITSTFTADSLYALSGKNFIGIRKGNYDINLLHDSIQGFQPKGFVSFENILAYTPEMGIPVKLLQSKISFDNKSIALDKAHLVFGKSDIYVTGEIAHLFPKEGEVTKGRLKIQGSYIDANELMTAMQKGQEFYDKTFVTATEPEPAQELLPGADKTIFSLPRNVELELETALDKVLFGTLDLQDIHGRLEMKDGHLDLKNFRLKTLAADLELKSRYIPVNNKSARLIFALDVRNIDMHNLHRLAPGMDTLLPMIKYFEGQAQFSVRGTGLLNENLEVDAGSLKGFAGLKATDIMVLDNETFRDLAKTLMFKSKEKNTVDILDVEMLLDNSRMEVLPAHIEIDRYELAVGGLQNLDFTYDYHISVLKSPIPFKMGVDLKGDFDKYRISLAKARYKFYFTDKKRLKDKADADVINKKKFIQDKLNF